MSRIRWGKKVDWPVVATRVEPAEKKLLYDKHPNNGEVSMVLRALIKRYLEGRIIGLRLEN